MSARTEAHSRALVRSPALVLALVALVLQTGCRDKTAPETTVPPGFVAVRDASTGFAIGIPSDWLQIPLPQDLDEFDKKARDLTATNDRLGPAIIQARQLLQFGGKLMAVSPDGSSIVNLTTDKTKEKSLDEIATAVVPQLQENGAMDVNQERTTTGAGPALKLAFRYPIPQGDQSVIANEVQYYVLHKGKSYVLTVINPPSGLADTIAGTLRLR